MNKHYGLISLIWCLEVGPCDEFVQVTLLDAHREHEARVFLTEAIYFYMQILLDVVTVFNVASSLSRKEQSVKLTQDGLEVYQQFYTLHKFF